MKTLSANTATLNIGLAGQPNTGKSTLFNRLTGGRQHVGNWPGKTVERKSGVFSRGDTSIGLVDLPGTYSISANSAEELISRNHIVSDEMDALVVMVDASQLQRSMYLLAELTGIDTQVLIACTMVDVAESQGKNIDFDKLEQKLGIPVAAINAAKGEGIETLTQRVSGLANSTARISEELLEKKYHSVIGDGFDKLVRLLPEHGIGKYSPVWLATRLIERDLEIVELTEATFTDDTIADIDRILADIKDGPLSVANARYAWIEEILADVVKKDTADHVFTIKGFDRFATHWLWGKVLAVTMILSGIIASMLVISPVIGLYYYVLPMLAESINSALTTGEVPPLIHSFMADALFPGISIAFIMFFCIASWIFLFAVMENVGYVSRIAYVFDSWMERLGLHGKSIMPFVIGFICNIIGVAGARVIDSSAQRRKTIVTSLAIPCLGCWGVVILVASIFFGIKAIWVVMSLLLATILHISFTAWLFRDRSTRLRDAPGLIMELPPYHKPSWLAIFQFVLGRSKNIATKAGTTILVVIILIWALTYSGTGDITGGLLYSFGKAVEPISMLIGFDWRLLIAIIFSAFAKEAALGVIAILFGVSEFGGTSLGSTVLTPVGYDASQLTHAIGSGISKASALAFIFAFYFNVPCLATIAIIHSETHSKRFTALVAIYYFLMALVIAGIVYRIGLIIF